MKDPGSSLLSLVRLDLFTNNNFVCFVFGASGHLWVLISPPRPGSRFCLFLRNHREPIIIYTIIILTPISPFGMNRSDTMKICRKSLPYSPHFYQSLFSFFFHGKTVWAQPQPWVYALQMQSIWHPITNCHFSGPGQVDYIWGKNKWNKKPFIWTRVCINKGRK